MNEEYSFDELAPWFVAALTVVGGLLRVLLLAAKGMWLDETVSVWFAAHPVGDLLAWVTRIDPHPPLYYLLLHAWMGVMGPNPNEVRLLSVLFGAATIPVIYLIGKRLAGPAVGLAAAAFLAFSPYNIIYAQETRMYSLLTLNAALAIYALACLLTDPRATQPMGRQVRNAWRDRRTPAPALPEANEEFTYRRKPAGVRAWLSRPRSAFFNAIPTDLAWLGLIVFTALTLLTHNTAVFFVLATNLFVLGLWLWRKFRPSSAPAALQPPSLVNWFIAQLVVFLLWSPWLPSFVQQVSRVDQAFWLPFPTWAAVGRTLQVFLIAAAPGAFSQLFTVLLCVVLVLALVYYRRRLSVFVFLAALFVVPVVGELLVSLRRPIFYDRTLIWITVPLILLLAAGIAQLRYRYVMIGVVGVFAAAYLFAVSDYYRFYQKEDWSTPAGYVANFAKNGDLVLFNSNFVEIAFDYYFAPWEEQYSLVLDKQGLPLDLIDTGVLEPKMTTADIPGLLARIQGQDRVWLVYSHNDYTDPQGIIPQTLAEHMRLTREREFYGGRVQLYEAN